MKNYIPLLKLTKYYSFCNEDVLLSCIVVYVKSCNLLVNFHCETLIKYELIQLSASTFH